MKLSRIIIAALLTISAVLFTTCNLFYDDDDDDTSEIIKVMLSGLSKATQDELKEIKATTIIDSLTDSTTNTTETYTLTRYENNKCILKTTSSASGLEYTVEYPGTYEEEESKKQTEKTGTITIKWTTTNNDTVTQSGKYDYSMNLSASGVTKKIIWKYHRASSMYGDKSGTYTFTNSTSASTSSGTSSGGTTSSGSSSGGSSSGSGSAATLSSTWTGTATDGTGTTYELKLYSDNSCTIQIVSGSTTMNFTGTYTNTNITTANSSGTMTVSGTYSIASSGTTMTLNYTISMGGTPSSSGTCTLTKQ